jgi:hypothetical protein
VLKWATRFLTHQFFYSNELLISQAALPTLEGRLVRYDQKVAKNIFINCKIVPITEWICSLMHSTKPLPPMPSASDSIKAEEGNRSHRKDMKSVLT